MAVYTHVSLEALKAFLRRYDIGALQSYQGVTKGIENSNYILTTDHGRFILTLFEQRVEEQDLPFFIDFMAHLRAAGRNCPAPVANRSGTALQELCDRPALITTFLNGSEVEDPGPDHCQKVGALMAQLHLDSADFSGERHNALGLEGWRTLADRCRARADTCSLNLAALIDDELAYLSANWPASLPRGVIHADLFPDNIFFQDGEVSGVIDFYFSCSDFYAYDVAITLCAWAGEGGWSPDRAAALLSGYEKLRPLTSEERQAMIFFLRGAALRFLLTRLYDWLNQVDGADVNVKDPLAYHDLLVFLRRKPDRLASLFS